MCFLLLHHYAVLEYSSYTFIRRGNELVQWTDVQSTIVFGTSCTSTPVLLSTTQYFGVGTKEYQ